MWRPVQPGVVTHRQVRTRWRQVGRGDRDFPLGGLDGDRHRFTDEVFRDLVRDVALDADCHSIVCSAAPVLLIEHIGVDLDGVFVGYTRAVQQNNVRVFRKISIGQTYLSVPSPVENIVLQYLQFVSSIERCDYTNFGGRFGAGWGYPASNLRLYW